MPVPSPDGQQRSRRFARAANLALVVVALLLVPWCWAKGQPAMAAICVAAAVAAAGNAVLLRRREALESEIEVRKSAELAARAADRAKTEFLANVSHEIRTPLHAVVGVVDLLLRGDVDPYVREHLEIVETSAEALRVLVDDILDLSKIEAHKLSLDDQRFRLRKLFHQVERLLAPRAASKGLDFHVEIAPRIPDAVHGDPARLRQVLVNLIGNAVKFTDRGEVAVIVELTHRDHRKIGLRCTVRDTGPGISAADQQKLFQPFSQADSTTARHYGGSGLGLVISKHLVELMGGRIGFDSEPGSGSTFWFEVTLEAAVTGTGELEPVQGPQPGSQVLIVDDHDLNRRLAVSLVASLGCRVDAVTGGAEALAALERETYDAVLMDCQMPGLDGYETTRRLRRREGEGARTPVIAVTAHAMEGERQRCLAAGMDDYLAKPYRGTELAAVLGRWVPAAALDPLRLRAIQKLDAKASDEAVSTYLSEGPRCVAGMRQALAARNWADLRQRAHDLAGSSVFLGAQRVAELSKSLAVNARSRAAAACGPLVDELEDELRRVASYLKARAD